MGSSPQVRGTSSLSAKPRAAVGIIPAGAGHLFIRGIKPDKNGDHPRRCGALCGVGYPGSLRTGSSPQVRGTLKAVSCAIKTCRIIPAGAGHFCQNPPGRWRLRDHPRRCGALETMLLRPFQRVGSSPQVRGTSCKPWRLKPVSGIIPAGAGHLLAASTSLAGGAGSSPQVRGTSG